MQTIIMKQGNTSRVDKGWERIQPILEKELPLKKEKRRALWLWMFPLFIGISSIAYYVFTLSAEESIELQKAAELTTPLASANQSKDLINDSQSTITQNKLKKENTSSTNKIIEEQSDKHSQSKNIVAEAKERSLSASPNHKTKQQKSSELQTAITEVTKLKTKKATTKKIAESSVYSANKVQNNSQYQNNTATLNTPATSQAFKPTKSLAKQALTELPILSSLTFLTITNKDKSQLKLNSAYSITLNEKAITPQLDKNKSLYPSLSITGFSANQLRSKGVQASLGLSMKKNKWTYGFNLGAGLLFKQFDTVETFLDGSKADSLSLAPNSSFSSTSQILPTNKYYLVAGLTGGYKIASHLSIKGQVGLENYFQNSQSLFDQNGNRAEETPAGGGILLDNEDNNINTPNSSKVIIGSKWQPYAQLGFAYQYKIWSIESGYRVNFNSLFEIGEQAYKGNKIFVGLKLSF